MLSSDICQPQLQNLMQNANQITLFLTWTSELTQFSIYFSFFTHNQFKSKNFYPNSFQETITCVSDFMDTKPTISLLLFLQKNHNLKKKHEKRKMKIFPIYHSNQSKVIVSCIYG